MKVKFENIFCGEDREYVVNSLADVKNAVTGMLDVWYQEQINNITMQIKDQLLTDEAFKKSILEEYRDDILDEAREDIIRDHVDCQLHGTDFSSIEELLGAYNDVCETMSHIYDLAEDIKSEAYEYA